MNVLLIGSGGREHAMAKSISSSPLINEFYTLPGNAGCENISTRIKGISVTDVDSIVKIAQEKSIDLVIVGPESPLIKGLSDALTNVSIPVFGCNSQAAQLEGSKIFAKNLMLENNIPTAFCEVFSCSKEAVKYIDEVASKSGTPIVVKADGEAAGKGVYVCQDPEDAKSAVIDILDNKIFGESGNQLIIEEFLDGQETTVLSFIDGEDFYVMPASQDYKRAYDNDEGLNTGGMGCYSPVPVFTEEIKEYVIENIIKPTLKALKNKGIKYQGVLYTGLALTSKGPKVVEFNVRFGDPETQVILPLMESDFLAVCYAVSQGKLAETEIKFSNKKALSIVLASGGYPGSYTKGYEITGLNKTEDNTQIFHAGTEIQGEKVVTTGGRVLNITVIGDSYKECIDKAYKSIENIDFKDKHYRHDIGKRLL